MSRSIKTPITEHGELAMGGNTGLGSLMAIGAMYHTSVYDKDQAGCVIQTDAEGLSMLACDTDSAIDAICLTLEALGKLLAYSDTDEVGEHAFKNLGWMMVSFGEMGIQLQDARRLIEENIVRHREQGRATA